MYKRQDDDSERRIREHAEQCDQCFEPWIDGLRFAPIEKRLLGMSDSDYLSSRWDALKPYLRRSEFGHCIFSDKDDLLFSELCPIGSGATGLVCKARQHGDDGKPIREVAIKFLAPSFAIAPGQLDDFNAHATKRIQDRFRREKEFLALSLIHI